MLHLVDTDHKLKNYTGKTNCDLNIKKVKPIAAFWNEQNVCKRCLAVHHNTAFSRTYAFNILAKNKYIY